MKKFLYKLLLLPLLLITVLVSGQPYTLQFNQAKLVGTVETVPSGKVWKVEGFLPSTRLTTAVCTGSTSCTSSSTENTIIVDGTTVYLASSNASGHTYGYNSVAAVMNNVFWLPAGTTLAAGTGVFRVSVLEFNLATP
jgi:hypothetical protein